MNDIVDMKGDQKASVANLLSTVEDVNFFTKYDKNVNKINSVGDIETTVCQSQSVENVTSKVPSQLSKRQLKRLKKKEIWLSRLSEKRLKEKIKLKLKRQEAREKNIILGPTRKELKNHKMSSSKCKIKVVLDFSFDQLMNGRDISKCINQVLRCYSYNRRAENPLQFYVVNFNGESKGVMEKNNGYRNWDVYFHNETYLDIFDKESLVYLTSDSENVLESLDEKKVYVIGALVDHNSFKGLCYKTAVEQGIGHAQLPLEKYVDMKTRKVLAISHVFDILLHVGNGMSWTDAFLKVLPLRKGATEKQTNVPEN